MIAMTTRSSMIVKPRGTDDRLIHSVKTKTALERVA